MGKWIRNWFSNFEALDQPFIYQGLEFKTVETFFQAMKVPKDNYKLREKIASFSPWEAKKFCSHRARNFELRPDWEAIKIEVMKFALKIKFAKGTSWYKKLMETTDPIVEWNNWHDNIWGECICEKCKARSTPPLNHLGLLLTEIREKHKQKYQGEI